MNKLKSETQKVRSIRLPPHFVIVSPNNKCYKDTKYFLSISYSTYLLNNEVGIYEYSANMHYIQCSFAVSYIFFSILSNIERNANMDTAPVSTQPLLWLQSRLLFKHGFSVGINQKPAFYAKECQFHRVNGLNSPRIVLLIVDSPFEIEKVFIAF
mgnify:CR=1 FL=1